MSDPREEKLPLWSRELIADLRKRLAVATEPYVRELSVLRPKMEMLKARKEAMVELIECAAKGGHVTSAEIAKMIEAYGIDKPEQP